MNNSKRQDINILDSTNGLIHKTNDGLYLPVRFYKPQAFKNELPIVIFINGSTPYDAEGNAICGFPILYTLSQNFPVRFFKNISEMGYTVISMTKRSFAYPEMQPRPSLDDFSQDIASLIKFLVSKQIINEKRKYVLVGYSEGSIVCSKVLGMKIPLPCKAILIGSGGYPFDWHKQSIDEWPYVLQFPDKKEDEYTIKKFKSLKELFNRIRHMTEEEFELTKSSDNLICSWESLQVLKELYLYDPVPNLVKSNVPILLCSGTNDKAMPAVEIERTFHELKKHTKRCSLSLLDGIGHEYNGNQVFKTISDWISSLYD